ncbi:MAG: hypothetical protein WCG92_02965 [Hyphomicrobiales bacterium]
MKVFATIVAASIFGLLVATPGLAQPAVDGVRAGGGLAQSQPKRARPRILVRPIYPYRRYHTTYPVPYAAEYPGPNAKRECVALYVEEHRPSGTVVVPRVNCRWVRS